MNLSWKTCFRVGLSVFLLFLCITYWSSVAGFIGALLGAAVPLLTGCAIAYVINILMSFYEKHYFPKSAKSAAVRSRRPVCMVAAFVTLVLIVFFLLKLVIPQLAACVELLFAQIPGAIDSLLTWLRSLGVVPEDILSSLQEVDWKSRLEDIITAVTTGVGGIMGTAFTMISSVFSGIVTALMALIFSIYLLLGKETLGRQCHRIMGRYMKPTLYEKTCYVLSVLDDCFHRYIVGQCTEAVILGTLCMIGMLIFRFPYAAMVGAFVAFTALIPVAGAYIGAGVGAFMILTVSPVKALLFLVYIVVLQQLEGNLIYPKVVGSSMGLPAIWVLAAVTVGGGVMGVAGMLLGVPLAATAYRLLREDVAKHSLSQESETEGSTAEPPSPS